MADKEIRIRNILLIPALDPDEKLIDCIHGLHLTVKDSCTRIVIVDDGSGPAAAPFFQQAEQEGCLLCRHAANQGKGAAIKTGIREAIRRYGSAIRIVTLDADGQHAPADVLRILQMMDRHPAALVLGVRDFSGKNVPTKSRWGNRITSMVFRLSTGIKCLDTQTGLRGIPSSLLQMALAIGGDRYEYEMDFLQEAAGKAEIIQIPIQTIYEDGNKCSHFRPVRDSILIYRRVLRFASSSILSAIVDYALFTVLLVLLAGGSRIAKVVFFSVVLARFGSGALNFYLNKNWSFTSKGNAGGEAIRYLLLFLAQMGISAGSVSMLSLLIPALAAKVIIDSALFCLSYQIQKKWVFSPGKV